MGQRMAAENRPQAAPCHLSFHPDVVDVRDNRHRGLCLEHGPGSFEVDQVVACQQRDTLCTVQGERG